MNKRHLLVAAVASLPAVAQDNYWIANRASSDIMRVSSWGSVLDRVATPTTLRGCTVAPDGKVWIVRFIQATFDIYDPVTATMTPVASPGGSPYMIAFDAAGTAWITNGASAVHQFSPTGTFLQTINLTAGAALGITIDATGNKWIAHRVTPASVSRIDPTGVATNFPIVGTSTMLPVGIIADYRGVLAPSRIWVTGDSASQLAEIDGTTGATLNLYTVPLGSLAAPVFDLTGRIWLSSFGNGTILQIDETNGGVLQTLTFGPNNISLSLDNLGRLRATSRVTFSGVGPPCEVRRIQPVGGALEIPTLLTFNGLNASGTQWQLSTQFQYCLVVAQTGDLDGDGEANLTEILAGTSPTDATSSSSFSVESYGVTQNGSSPTFEIRAPAATIWALAFSRGLFPPTPIPGLGGTLRIDPLGLFLVIGGNGNLSLPIAIPADPSLAGLELFVQGLTFNGASFDFRNVAGMRVW